MFHWICIGVFVCGRTGFHCFRKMCMVNMENKYEFENICRSLNVEWGKCINVCVGVFISNSLPQTTAVTVVTAMFNSFLAHFFLRLTRFPFPFHLQCGRRTFHLNAHSYICISFAFIPFRHPLYPLLSTWMDIMKNAGISTVEQITNSLQMAWCSTSMV